MVVKGDINEIKDYLRMFNPIMLEVLPVNLEEIFIYEMERKGMVSMINKDYFKYLIKQNKKYLILIYVIGIIIPFLLINKFDYAPLNDENNNAFCTNNSFSLWIYVIFYCPYLSVFFFTKNEK